MTLFDTDGHLTDEAIAAAIQETLDELARLEVAEHLSFCDNCLLRYTAMLTDDTLLTPQTPIAAPFFKRVRQNTVRVLFNKYTTYAAAASFSLVLWGTGVFTGLLPMAAAAQRPNLPAQRPAATQRQDSVLDSMSSFLSGVLDWSAAGGWFASPQRTAAQDKQNDAKEPSGQTQPNDAPQTDAHRTNHNAQRSE